MNGKHNRGRPKEKITEDVAQCLYIANLAEMLKTTKKIEVSRDMIGVKKST